MNSNCQQYCSQTVPYMAKDGKTWRMTYLKSTFVSLSMTLLNIKRGHMKPCITHVTWYLLVLLISPIINDSFIHSWGPNKEVRCGGLNIIPWVDTEMLLHFYYYYPITESDSACALSESIPCILKKSIRRTFLKEILWICLQWYRQRNS